MVHQWIILLLIELQLVKFMVVDMHELLSVCTVILIYQGVVLEFDERVLGRVFDGVIAVALF